MSNENTEQTRTTKRARKPVNLATAHTADGEVRVATSVYEMMGISTHGYKQGSLTAYTSDLGSMNLAQLHDEAYNRAVLATDSRDVLIDRLKEKFIRETSKFKSPSERNGRGSAPESKKEDTIKDQALRILSRGR